MHAVKGTREKARVTMNILAAFLSALLLGGVAVFPGQPRAEIYKFTDRNGVIHFTNIPDQPRYQPWFKDRGPSRSERLDRYSRLIKEVAERHDVEPALIKAVVRAESDFNPSAISKKGAIGLMQLMPETMMDLDVNNPFAPAENLEAGVRPSWSTTACRPTGKPQHSLNGSCATFANSHEHPRRVCSRKPWPLCPRFSPKSPETTRWKAGTAVISWR
jgi:soluble lytic murein transglycosylase